MPEQSLPERQAEMRARMANGKRAQRASSIPPTLQEQPNEARPSDSCEILQEPDGSRTISRTDLYHLAWSEAVVKVAKRFGVSDVAVAKACRRHKIPLPGRGHWARIAAGQTIQTTPLPPIGEGWLEAVNFSAVPDIVAKLRRSESEEIQNEKSVDKKITVSESPVALHPLVSRTLALMSRGKVNAKGMLEPLQDALGLCVSPDQLSRGVLILDALIKALTARGYDVSAVEPLPPLERYSYWEKFAKWRPYARTEVVIADERLRFGLCETIKKVPHVPTREEKRQLEKGYGYGIPEFDEVPSGELSLWIHTSDSLKIRSQWQDGSKQMIENCLNSFIAGLIATANALKARREADERARIEREEEHRRWEEQEKRRREETMRVETLDQQMSLWRRAQDVRSYAEAIVDFAMRHHLQLEENSEVGQWVAWIRQYADRIDPIRISDGSVDD